MSIKAELIKLIVAQQGTLLKLLAKLEREEKAPVEYDPPFVPEKPGRNETHAEAMQRRNRDLVRSGRAISANMMRPGKRPPRKPGQQSERHNGLWGWWT